MTQPPDPVPTTNQPAQAVVDVVETLVGQGETAAENAIIAAEPWMGAPLWRQLWEALFDWVVQVIMKPLAMLSGRVVISVEEYVALKTAVDAQLALDAAKKKGSPQDVSKASQDVDRAVAGVVHYIGGTHP